MKAPFRLLLAAACLALAQGGMGAEAWASHPPTRPLPVPSDRPRSDGPGRFVDAARGNDSADGSEGRPWKTVARAARDLKPGDTLYLRGGIYREAVALALKGAAGKPITLRSFPGELAVIDCGIADFHDDPAHAWVPCPDGAEGEYMSAKSWPAIQPRPESTNVEGNFADSMVPIHGTRMIEDLRSDNPYWGPGEEAGGAAKKPAAAKGGKTSAAEFQVYPGPGTWFDAKTGRIHIRLAHTKLPGLEASGSNYKGETDPRKLRLIIAGRGLGTPLTLTGSFHVRFEDLVLRGGLEAEIRMEYCADITLDGVTAYGGSTVLGVANTVGLRMLNTAFRGCSAPWVFRGHLKYRAVESSLIKAGGWTGAGNRDYEIAWCEFTDTIDGLFLGTVAGVKFHHNYVENFSDDGIFVTAPTMYDGRVYGGNIHVYQNYLGRLLTTFAFGVGHGRQKVLPGENKGRQTGAGVWVSRNVFDYRKWVYYEIPPGPGAPQEFSSMGRLAGDHGSPAWEPIYFYQNTVILGDSPWRGIYGGGLGLTGIGPGSKRQVFNNIFMCAKGMPGNVLADGALDLQADGNLHWSFTDGAATVEQDFFARFRTSKGFDRSKNRYAPGWTTHDRFADPKFVAFSPKFGDPLDLRLQADSPAVKAGVPLPPECPDPLRAGAAQKPDVGALPLGSEPWRLGVRGRYTMFGHMDGSTVATALESRAVKLEPSDLVPRKPAALVEGYPAYEARFVENALEQEHFAVTVVDKAWLSPSDFDRYAFIAYSGDLARAQVKPSAFSAEDLAKLKAWLERGGTLLLTPGRISMFQGPGMPFLESLGYRPPQRKSPPFEPAILKPDHPWVKQMKREGGADWLKDKRAGSLPAEFERAENIIGDEAGRSILCRLPVGKGQIIYLGWHIQNFQPSGRDYGRLTTAEDQVFEDQVNVLANIAAGLRP